MTTLSMSAAFRFGGHNVVIYFLTTKVESHGECYSCHAQATGTREWVFPIEVSIDGSVVDVASPEASKATRHLCVLYKHGQIACGRHKFLLESARNHLLGL